MPDPGQKKSYVFRKCINCQSPRLATLNGFVDMYGKVDRKTLVWKNPIQEFVTVTFDLL